MQWTWLEPLLRGLGVEEMAIYEEKVNICVETTVRSAFMRDYPVTLLADCCAREDPPASADSSRRSAH